MTQQLEMLKHSLTESEHQLETRIRLSEESFQSQSELKDLLAATDEKYISLKAYNNQLEDDLKCMMERLNAYEAQNSSHAQLEDSFAQLSHKYQEIVVAYETLKTD